MLVLTRRIGEKIIIRDDIEITILGQYGAQTRIGITAPKDISVHRKEIYERIKEQKLNGEEVIEPKDKIEEVDEDSIKDQRTLELVNKHMEKLERNSKLRNL